MEENYASREEFAERSVSYSGKWIDVTVPIKDGMLHWPGDSPAAVSRILNMDKGDKYNLSSLAVSSHAGTHIDAPLHFIKSGASIDKLPWDVVIGPARIIAIKDERVITTAELAHHDIRPGERILFKTKNSSRLWYEETFQEEFVYLSDEAADYLAERKVRLIGIDYLSVGSYHEGGKYAHEALLGGGVWILEGLYLGEVTPESCYLLCLPMKIEGGEGAPARVIIRPPS